MGAQDATREIVQYNCGILDQLSGICAPIFTNFGFNGFGYTRIQDNGHRLIFETNQQWLETYSHDHFKENNDSDNSLISNLNSLILNPHSQELHIQILTGKPKSKLHENLLSLGIWNSVSIYVNLNKFIEVYHLSTSNEDNRAIIDLCVNKKYLLQRFLHYFREKIYRLNVEKAPYVYDDNLSKVFSDGVTHNLALGDKNSHNYTDHSIQNYIDQTQISKYYLKTHNIFIPRREAECLHYLSAGKSVKEIARHLNISTRTVESYINSLKNKTGTHSKTELAKIAHASHINELDFMLHVTDKP